MACRSLCDRLIPDGFDLESLFPELGRDKLPSWKSKRLTSVGQVVVAGFVAISLCQNALDFLNDDERNGKIHGDLWSAWACLVGREFEKAGFKITGASLDKILNESPAIQVMERLQNCLPNECRKFHGYESVRISVQKANSQFGKISENALFGIFAGWASLILTGYPGQLISASKDAIVKFEDSAHQTFEQIEGPVRKPRKRNP